MFDIDCDNCGSTLNLDQKSTIDSYLNDADYRIDEDTERIVEATIQQYLVYACSNCGSKYKFTYKDWEKRQRQLTAEFVMELRKQDMFKTKIDPRTISEDSGVEFCGQCSGYNGDGYCLNDIIKQCTIRKKDV